MMRCIAALFIIFMMLFGTQSHAQREAANWYFGDRAGLSFNSGLPVALQNGNLQTSEGSATISDRNGNLLFYTDGITIYTRDHSSMPNGSGLKGNVSTTQSAIIIPKPAHPGIYYVFTVDKPDYALYKDEPIEGVHFSEIDMSLNGGLGDVIPNRKNIHLLTYNPNNAIENEFKSSEKISAVISDDCISYWVVTQFTDKFYSFNVSASGVNTTPVISTLSNNFQPILNDNFVNVTASGYLKISPNGKKMAAAYTGTSLGSPRSGGTKNTGKVFLYDFDDTTGKVSNEQLLLLNTYPYGIEFSPESTKLYATANSFDDQDILKSSELIQFDLESNNIAASKTMIHTSTNVAGALQLAINGRIYRAGYPMVSGAIHHNFLSVINKPELLGNNINYSHNSVDISPADVKLGLPPFVQSLFKSNFEIEKLCFGNVTKFIISGVKDYTTVLWDFGDGITSVSEFPAHTYTESGTFTVSLIKFFNGIPVDTVCKEIIIVEIPDVPTDFVLNQCDTQDNDPMDGLTEFNLQLAKDYLTAGNNALQIFFYTSKQDAENDTRNQNALNNIYRNTRPNEILFAKVTSFGSDCFNISEIKLKTTISISLNPSPASGCDRGDGTAGFNLKTIESNILAELNLDPSIHLTFHNNENDAALGANSLPEDFISSPGTFYIRANDENICYGFGQFDFQLIPFPSLSNQYELNICSSEFPLELGNSFSLENPGDFSFEWNTGETTQTIIVQQGGVYSLKLIKTAIGCGRDVQFLVNELPTPEITNIAIESNGETSELTVFTSSDEGNLYSLDDINGSFQTSSVFRNVPGGPHTIFVKNDNACEIKQQKILVFGFPQFFTPNNDGYYDTWKPFWLTDPEYQIKSMYIFDRYGKLLKQLDPNGNGWDGTFNNRDMPGDDYWFNVILENGREFKGHFSLKR